MKNLKPSFERLLIDKSPENYPLMDKWLDNLHKLTRYGERVPNALEVKSDVGIKIRTDYKNVTRRVISSTTTNVNIGVNPQISSGIDNQVITLEGSDDTRTVTLQNGSGLVLKGGTNFILKKHDVINLHFNKKENVWVERFRSQNS